MTTTESKFWIKALVIIISGIIAVAMSIVVMAQQYPPIAVYPTTPGTSLPDYTQPGWIQQGTTIWQTTPGTNLPDFTRPGYTIRVEPRGLPPAWYGSVPWPPPYQYRY